MEIKTKFEVGEYVYFLRKNKIAYQPIEGIEISIRTYMEEIKYILYEKSRGSFYITDKEIFKSRDDALKSIQDE